MTTLYLFIGSITYLLVSFNQVTVLHFERELIAISMGEKRRISSLLFKEMEKLWRSAQLKKIGYQI